MSAPSTLATASDSLSNRRESCFLRKPPGLDRLSLSFPVADFDSAAGSWDQVTYRRVDGDLVPSYGLSLPLGDGATVFAGVAFVPNRGFWGKVEFNPSRLADPAGTSLADVGFTRSVVPGVLAAAQEVLSPGCSADECRVKRVDVARDFHGIASPPALIRALAPVHRPYARRNLVHADPSRSGAQTLMVGSGAGVVRLYDKHAESDGKAAEGTVRWEAECRAGWAKKGGIRTVADLETESVQELARDRWEWSSVGAEVGAMSEVVDKVRDSELSPREQTMFLGYLVDQAHGGGYLPGKKALAKWRKVQRELGIAVGDLGSVADQAGGFLRRLDWETGTEVYRVG